MRKNASLIHSIEKPIKDIFIYGLCDPDTNELKYIGLSTVGFKRLKDHYETCYKLSKKSTLTNVKIWIKTLKQQNKIFKPIYLEYFDIDSIHVDEAEKFWISYFRSIGSALLNMDSGGRSNYGKYTLETRIKMSETISKIMNTPENKQLISERSKKNWSNPEIRQKILNGMNQGFKKTPEQNRNRMLADKTRLILKDDKGNTFNCMQEAADYYKVHKTVIQRVLQGKTRKYSHIKLNKISGGRVQGAK